MLETPRLIIRQWEAKDRGPFTALNADPDVMRFIWSEHAVNGMSGKTVAVGTPISQLSDGQFNGIRAGKRAFRDHQRPSQRMTTKRWILSGTTFVKAQLKCPLSSSIKMTTLISHSLY